MVNTKIILSIAIVLLIGIAAASYQMTTSSQQLWQPTTSQEQTSSDSSNTQSEQTQSGTQGGTTSGDSQGGDGGNNVKISSDEAKSIAQQSIELQGATAGTPQLTTMNGQKVYVVPVIDENGEKVGEIWVDPETGENIGGAGGAP
ncbi:PepSY domain-containing protein [Methanobacterium oryzae]|uniref:PepSY domain-containing protein n=1 Tax=Methanobacterium oryzae TaxID=69540 RepID=UPI003D1DA140